mmetsp:Transcript_15808/g.39727  ORF Transcript_15808/g.39727 Transcript_15808/m.39727 type:complete len:108 (+) Transcript_15808:308-631(+)
MQMEEQINAIKKVGADKIQSLELVATFKLSELSTCHDEAMDFQLFEHDKKRAASATSTPSASGSQARGRDHWNGRGAPQTHCKWASMRIHRSIPCRPSPTSSENPSI